MVTLELPVLTELEELLEFTQERVERPIPEQEEQHQVFTELQESPEDTQERAEQHIPEQEAQLVTEPEVESLTCQELAPEEHTPENRR